jgi:hypothetical protein
VSTSKQMEKMEREAELRLPNTSPPPNKPMPEALWDASLRDPAHWQSTGFRSNKCRLSEIPRHVLRVGRMRCSRIVEVQKADAIRFYGPHVVWKDIASDCWIRRAAIAWGVTRKTAVARNGFDRAVNDACPICFHPRRLGLAGPRDHQCLCCAG